MRYARNKLEAAAVDRVLNNCSWYLRDIYLILGQRQRKSHAAQQLATSETGEEKQSA